MKEADKRVYAALDRPEVLRHIFHPRTEWGRRPSATLRDDLMIPVEEGIRLSASFHHTAKDAPTLLFFHGNGEIAADYDDLGVLFNRVGLNFLVVDYRGYGRANGTPTMTSMMADCHRILDYTLTYRKDNGYTRPLAVMGRSLGSASAIELGSTRSEEFKCLIVESGFARLSPLLRILGIDPESIGFHPQPGLENVDKIKLVADPCLIIHAQFDHIIPFSEGRALFDACAATDKTLLEIKGANHNDIFQKGIDQYLMHVKKICEA